MKNPINNPRRYLDHEKMKQRVLPYAMKEGARAVDPKSTFIYCALIYILDYAFKNSADIVFKTSYEIVSEDPQTGIRVGP